MKFNELSLLRKVLMADAAISGMTGALMAAGAGFLNNPLGISENVLVVAGIGLLPFAVFVGWLAGQNNPAPSSLKTVAAINVAWVIASITILVAGIVTPTALGVAFVIAQAVVVAFFAEAQLFSLKRRSAVA